MSMTELEAPAIEADANRVQISPTPPSDFEYGSHTFGREITTHLGWLLKETIAAPLYRCNPFDRRPCPQAESFEFTAAGHHIRIVAFQDARGLPAYAIHLSDQRVEFELTHYGDYGWQLARGVWIAIRDRPPASGPTGPHDPTDQVQEA